MRSVQRLPGAEGPIEKNEKLLVDFGGMKSQVNVLVRSYPLEPSRGPRGEEEEVVADGTQANTPAEFRWRGDLLFLLSGEHTFRFEPSQINPGKTLLINNEEPFRLNVILMRLVPAEKMFKQFCEEFKTRVEAVVKGEAR